MLLEQYTFYFLKHFFIFVQFFFTEATASVASMEAILLLKHAKTKDKLMLIIKFINFVGNKSHQ